MNTRVRPDTTLTATWLARIVAATVGLSLLFGALAALAGGPVSDLGYGPGGLGGLPFLILTGAVVVGIALAIVALRRGDTGLAAWVGLGTISVWVTFQIVAHALDPCYTGLASLRAEMLGTRICDFYSAGGFGLHIRWHLLEHALVTAPVAGVLWFGIERLWRAR